MSDGKVTISTELDNKGLEKGIKNIDSSFSGLKSSLAGIGKLIAGAFAVNQVVSFGKSCIELGSQVAEVQNVVDTAFGEMSGVVENFAKSSIQNFGMSTLAAKKTASNYMAMARGMGVAMDEASNMSIALTGLSADVASFYNLSQEDAAYKLQSVFTGETETLKELGVVMTQVNLQNYAMQHGMNSNIQSMTQAEQVALRYAYVTDALSLASGDFVRTQDSWANQTRILSMQWQEFMSLIGQAMTTILLPLVKTLNSIVSALISMATAFASVIAGIFGGEVQQVQQTQAAVSGVSSGISEAVDNQNALTDATKATNKEQAKSLASFDQINRLAEDTASSGGGGGSSSGGLDTSGGGISIPGVSQTSTEVAAMPGLLDKVTAALSPFRSAFDTAFSSIEAGAGRIVGAFQTAWTDVQTLSTPILAWIQGDLTTFFQTAIVAIGTVVGGVMDSVGMVLQTSWSALIFPVLQKMTTDILPFWTQVYTEWYKTLDVLFQTVKEIFDMIWMDAVVPAMELIFDVWSSTWDSVIGVWEEHGQPIFDGINEAIKKIGEFLQNVWNTIVSPVLDYAMDKFSQVWDESLHPLVENVLEFAAILGETALAVLNNFILPMVGWFVDSFGPGIVGVLEGVIDGFFGLVRFVSDAVNSVVTVVKGFYQIVKGIFTGDFSSVMDGFKNIFKGAFNFVLTMAENFINFFVRGINSIISGLNTLNFSIPDWVPLPIAGKRFGINIGKVPEVRLPRLATGSIVPPNKEFAAILGDNKTEPEVVSPLSTMKQALLEALQEAGVGGATEVVLKLDGKVLARNQVKHINDMTRASGAPVLIV